MPEDQDARLRAVEIAVGSLGQRVQDHEGDIHRFGPLVTEQALLRQMFERELKSINGSLDRAHEAVRHLDTRLDDESRERLEGQRKRQEELEEAIAQRKREMAEAEERAANQRLDDERARTMQHNELKARLRIAALTLFGVMATSGISVVIAIITARGGK